MQTKTRLLLFVTMMLFMLSVAIIVNVSLNFREYSIKSEMKKAQMAAEIVKDGLTAHMVNGIMDKRKYFLDQIESNKNIQSLWIMRSKNVIKQYGIGFHNELIRDAIDKKVLATGKTIKKVVEHADKTILRVTVPYNAEVKGNGADCLACHNVSHGDTLGAISMEFDITSMRNSGIVTIIKIIGINIVFLLIALFLINYYVTPYMELFKNLQDGIKKAYRGDFSYQFSTEVSGDGEKIVRRINTLFRKMQDTFGHIKKDLGTFIPQESVSTSDPLFEAKTIISELSDIYKFKKTIELDASKRVVYLRLIDILETKYELKHFAIYEINNHTATRDLIYISNGETICDAVVEKEAGLCRAYRNKTDVVSTEFDNLCQSCHAGDLEYICIPFDINEENALLISITTKSKEELQRVNTLIANIKNYLEAIKPVLESKILMEALRDSSLRDAMTGLYNRRFLDEFIDKVMNQAQRENETYSVLMIDIDFFKKVNDTYGHDVGDIVITKIGKVLQENSRKSDLAIRYGGEEFVVMLHNAMDEGTLQVAKKIHTAFGENKFDVGNGEILQKTLSIGIAKFPTDGDTIWKTIKFADTALYVAKTTGRNKIVQYSKKMSENEDLQ